MDTEVLHIIGKHFREGTFPAHLIPRLAELGVLGAPLQGYGCAGMNTVSYGYLTYTLLTTYFATSPGELTRCAPSLWGTHASL